MTTVVPLKRRGDKKFADLLRGYADDVESGAITDFVFVACHGEDGTFMRSSSFQDRWRMLGALEYAKSSVVDAE